MNYIFNISTYNIMKCYLQSCLFCSRFYFCNICTGRGIHPNNLSTVMPFYVRDERKRLVEDKDRLLRSNEFMRSLKAKFCSGKPKGNSERGDAYRALVKGEFCRSPLELAKYMDLIFGCPLDAMHWLFGGIIKDFWKDVLFNFKKQSRMSEDQVKAMFGHFNRLKPPARWQRGCKFTLEDFRTLKMSDFMIPTECFPVSFYKCVTSDYKEAVLCITIMIRYLMMPTWQREFLLPEDKNAVKKINRHLDRLFFTLPGYGEGCYSLNTHHLSHAFYLAEKFDGNFGLYRYKGYI